MRLDLKCDYAYEPSAVDPDDVVFTVGANDGECDFFEFVLSCGDEKVYVKRIDGGRFAPLRLIGKGLKANVDYTWSVRAVRGGETAAYGEARFHTAFLPEKAEWIGYMPESGKVIKYHKTFSVGSGLKSARLFICGLGFFESGINGKRTDDGYFKPLFYDYAPRDKTKNPKLCSVGEKKVGACVYDVLPLLRVGENTLEVLLGKGYFENEDKPEEPFVSFGKRRLIFELRLSYGDGEQTVYSDGDTLAAETGMRSDLFEGDVFDFRFGVKVEEFAHAEKVTPIESRFVFPRVRPDCAERIEPVSVSRRGGKRLYDFGINHTGGLTFAVRGRCGQKIKVRYAEVLDANGEPVMETGAWQDYCAERGLHRIEQTAEYVLSGGTDIIRPLFCWRCYRYAEIDGLEDAETDGLCSLFLHTETQRNGNFYCSEPLLNRLYEASMLTYLDNLHCGVLSDCPHREKRPYTGDAQVACEAAMYMLGGVCLYEKIADDIICSRHANGFVPYSAPYMGGGGGFAWSAAIAFVPYVLYSVTGDAHYPETAYDALLAWVEYCKKKSVNGIIPAGDENWQLGDWLSPDVCEVNVSLINTICYYASVATAEYFSAVLHKGDKEKELALLKKEIADAVNGEFFDPETLSYARGEQGEDLYPLFLGIVPPKYREGLLNKIRTRYSEQNGSRPDTGFLLTPILFRVLLDNGMADEAYGILTRREYPSYAYLLDGETTLSEHWSKKWPDYRRRPHGEVVKGGGDLSHCHTLYGSVAAVLVKYAAGIDLSGLCEGKIVFAPRFTHRLSFAGAEESTVYGDAAAEWKRDGETLTLKLTVPSGITGEVVLPVKSGETLTVNGKEAERDGNVLRLSSGEWEIVKVGASSLGKVGKKNDRVGIMRREKNKCEEAI